MRKNMLAGNWKMNMSAASTKEYFNAMSDKLVSGRSREHRLGYWRSLHALATAVESKPSAFSIASQSVHWEDTGAFTGEISAEMLKELGVNHAIIGHSERRQFFGETDETVLKRTGESPTSGNNSNVCVGELLADREAGNTEAVVKSR